MKFTSFAVRGRLIFPALLFTSLMTLSNLNVRSQDSTGQEFVHFFSTPIDTHKAVQAPMRELKDPAGFTFIDYAYGKGDSVSKGRRCFIRFLGAHANGNYFDTNFCAKKLFSFTVGNNELLKGLELGLLSMREGGRRQIHIPSVLAYAEAGNASAGIMQNESLIFYVELVKIE